jgi:RNA-binding protein 5/10
MHGSLYILDGRRSTMMFYEPKSDFFYDPKSALYYGNKQRAYYRYNPTLRPAFQEVTETQSQSQSQSQLQKTEPQIQSPKKQAEAPDSEQVVASSKQQELPEKTTIEINVKIKKLLPKKKSKAARKSNGIGSQEESYITKNHAQRQQVANIDKWNVLNGKQEAKTEQFHGKEEVAEDHSKHQERKSSTPSSIESATIFKTTKGEPVCTFCMRKFRSMEQLRRHESVSQLHKDNMRKAAELERKKREQESKLTKRPAPAVKYEDRAKKRRVLHGEMQGEGVAGRREAAIMSLKAPQSPSWLKPKGMTGIYRRPTGTNQYFLSAMYTSYR